MPSPESPLGSVIPDLCQLVAAAAEAVPAEDVELEINRSGA